MKRAYLFFGVLLLALLANAAAPNGSGTYYSAADGKKAAALKSALRDIVQTTTEKSYDYLWTAFQTTDKRGDGKVWDMYSNITNYTFVTDQAGNFNGENQKYNREHSFPKSWFGGEVKPMYTDLHHMYPTDGWVNGKRDNYPFGETLGNKYKSANDFSKLGNCTYPGYTGVVFEPADEYKGDFARTYFYMVTRYEEKLPDWYTKYSDSRATLDGSSYPAFQIWQLNMLLAWAADDPVSDKETARNNAVDNIQHNRNPFIDYPGLEQYIWGSKIDDTFSYDNYVEPTEYTGYNEGGGQGGQGGETGEGITYKLTITPADFNTTSYVANNNEKTSYAVCTTDASKTYEVKWRSYQVMKDGETMQWEKNKGYIYNCTNLGSINSVTITKWSGQGTYTTYYGIAELPSSSTEVGGGYFKTIVSGEKVGKTKSVEVTFTISDGGSTPINPSFNNLTDVSVVYGSPLTLTKGTSGTPNIVTNGDVTLRSSNESVVTVYGLTITPVAVGSALISVNTTATSAYNAGSVIFPITVNAPEGKTTAKPSEPELLFGETFGSNTGSARVWNDSYSVKNGISDVYSGITSYTISNAKQSKNTVGFTESGLIQTTQGTDAYIIIGPLNVANYSDLSLTYQWKASSVNGTYSTSAYYATSSTGSYTALSGSSAGATTFVECSYSLPAAAQVSTLYLKIVWNTSNTGGVIDEVSLSSSIVAPITAKFNNYGYASFCSEYPLDFTNVTDFSAWKITNISDETITFAKVTGSVKGGIGLLLMGEAGTTVIIPSVNSTNVLSDNLLYGTIVPTYAEANQYYGLKGKSFVPVAASIVPAGKALLPASIISGEEARTFTFVFEDDEDGIRVIENGQLPIDNDGAIYNLVGQRLSKMQKGINIVNGKKILMK